ncbi:hypothetical protein BH10PSE15_BH10PSE15_06620 [soil metagenome]
MTYIDGYVRPVPEANKQACRDMAAKVAPLFRDHGPLRIVETWAPTCRPAPTPISSRR